MIVGRAAELERLRAFLDEARAGHGGALMVAGEPGIGKTTVLRTAVTDVPHVWLTGVEAERDVPYAALTELIWPLRAHLTELSGHQRAALDTVLGLGPGKEPGRLMLGMAVLSLISAASSEGPLVVVADDIQWLDTPSRDALLFVARRLGAEPVAVLLGLRSETLDPTLVGGLARLTLAGLPEGDATRLLPGVAPHVVRRLAEGTAGNPLALTEAAAALGGAGHMGRSGLPETRPERLYAARLETLPAPARLAARLAAIAGDAPKAVLIAGLEEAGLGLVDLSGVEALGLLVLDERPSWRHPLARASASRGTTTEVIDCHRALAAAWGRIDSANPARAWHLAEASPVPDTEAERALVEAAELAERRGAGADATDAFERAATLTAGLDRRARLLVRAGVAASRCGQPARAMILLDAATELQPARTDTFELLELRSALADIAGDHGQAVDLLLRLMRNAEDPEARVRAALTIARTAGPDRAAELREAAAEVDSSRDPADPVHSFAHACVSAACATIASRDPDGSQRWAETARRIRIEHRLLEADPTLVLASLAAEFHSAENHAPWPDERAALDRLRLAGDLLRLPEAVYQAANREMFAGNWRGVREAVDEVALLARLGGYPVWLCAALLTEAEIHAVSGKALEAQELIAEVRQIKEAEWFHTGVWPTWWVEGRIHLTEGDLPAAAASYRRTAQHFNNNVKHMLPEFVTVIREAESPKAAQTELDKLRVFEDWPSFAVARTLATGDSIAAAAAIEAHVATGVPPWDAGFVLLHAGERLRREGRREDARRLLESALAKFALVEATPWISRAENGLAGVGLHVARRDQADALTPGELRVASLVAEGRPNKEVAEILFLSPKTVEFHLSSAYRKLGVTNRTALARTLDSR